VPEDLEGDPEPWKRQEFDTDPSWEAFTMYRDMGLGRSLAQVAENLGKSTTIMERWSSQRYWRYRVWMYDIHVDEQTQAEHMEEIHEMRGRHAQQARVFAQALMQPAVALLEKIRDEPEYFAQLLQADPQGTLDLVQKYAKVVPDLMKVERMSRGEPTDIHQLDAAIEDYRRDVDRILDDPGASQLANDLLRRIASED